jgi:hypothetical protein
MLNRLISLALAGALSLGLASHSFAVQGTGCMPTTGTISGLTFAQDVNAGIAALISSNSGSSAPTTDCSLAAVKGQVWLDTSVTPNLLKQYDGASMWVVIGALDATNHLWSPPIGGGTATVTAASTTDICAAPSAVQNITGTTTITAFGSSCVAGVRKTLIFGSATPLTYNATSLILPGQLSYTTAAGDIAEAVYLGSGNWRVINITKIDGSAVTNPATPLGTVLYGVYGTIPPKTLYGMGQAITRTSYPAYLAAVTRAQSGTLTAGNNTIASVGNTDGLGAGMPIEGTGIPAGTTIASVTSSSIVMSANATANGSQIVTAFITGYGSGGSSTTVGVMDCRGRTMAGRDGPLNTAASRLTSSFFGSGANAINTGAGSESQTLTLAQLPTGITSINSNAVSVSVLSSQSGIPSGATRGDALANGTGAWYGPASLSPLSVGQITSAGTIAIGQIGSASNNTSGSAHPIVGPMVTAECVVVVLP